MIQHDQQPVWVRLCEWVCIQIPLTFSLGMEEQNGHAAGRLERLGDLQELLGGGHSTRFRRKLLHRDVRGQRRVQHESRTHNAVRQQALGSSKAHDITVRSNKKLKSHRRTTHLRAKVVFSSSSSLFLFLKSDKPLDRTEVKSRLKRWPVTKSHRSLSKIIDSFVRVRTVGTINSTHSWPGEGSSMSWRFFIFFLNYSR